MTNNNNINNVSYSDYQKALETIDNYFKNRQTPNEYGAFKDSLKNEITFALRIGIKHLNDEYGLSTTKINVGGFPLAFTEMLAECVENALYEKYHDNNGKISAMDAHFKIRRKFV